MKRVIASALILGAVSGFGLVGCSDTSKVEDKQTVSTPEGTATKTTTTEVKTSGTNPPVDSAGQPGGTGAPK